MVNTFGFDKNITIRYWNEIFRGHKMKKVYVTATDRLLSLKLDFFPRNIAGLSKPNSLFTKLKQPLD